VPCWALKLKADGVVSEVLWAGLDNGTRAASIKRSLAVPQWSDGRLTRAVRPAQDCLLTSYLSAILLARITNFLLYLPSFPADTKGGKNVSSLKEQYHCRKEQGVRAPQASTQAAMVVVAISNIISINF